MEVLDVSKLVSILETSKNLFKIKPTHVEMQVFDERRREHFVKIDHQDIEMLSKIKWKAAIKAGGYVTVNASLNGTTITQARTILGLTDRDILCDHINRDPFDNRRKNLRICTYKQNMQNRRSLTGRKYKGIYYSKDREIWVAQIKIGDKIKNIGRSISEEACAKIYDEWQKKLYGDFACLNFPEDADVQH